MMRCMVFGVIVIDFLYKNPIPDESFVSNHTTPDRLIPTPAGGTGNHGEETARCTHEK
jgi:hypothetical protein